MICPLYLSLLCVNAVVLVRPWPSCILSVYLSVCLIVLFFVTFANLISSFWLSVSRPGNCPILQPPQFCVADYDECQFDTDCFPGKKCCNNSCFKRCVNPTFDQVGSGKLPNSPVIIFRHRNVWCVVSSSGVDRANYNLTRPRTEYDYSSTVRYKKSKKLK